MAKTIKELAREASYKAYENKPLKYENGKYQVGLSDGIEQGFELGAKAMLDKIEKLLDEFSNYEDSLIVRRVIEQLKK